MICFESADDDGGVIKVFEGWWWGSRFL